MAYPNEDEILAAATTYGGPVDYMYAFAATQGRVPGSSQEWANWVAQAGNEQRAVGVDISLLMGYATATGNFPLGNRAFVVSWAQRNGFADNAGNLIADPSPGYGYPPGGQAVDAPKVAVAPSPVTIYSANPAVTTTAGASSSGLGGIFGLFQNLQGDISQYKTELIVGGVAFLAWRSGILSSLFGHRRRY